MTKTSIILDYLYSCDCTELINIYNRYCEVTNQVEETIFNNDSEFINDIFNGSKEDLVRAISFGEYDYSDDYVKFDAYGNLFTTSNPETDWIDMDYLAAEIDSDESSYDDLIPFDEIYADDNYDDDN